MWNEIPAAHSAAQADLFPDPAAQGVLAAAAAGNSRARLWRAGPAALLWDQANNVLYLAGGPAREAVAELFGVIRAAALDLGRPRVGLRVLGDADPAPLLSGFPGPAPALTMRHFYAQPRPAAAALPMVEGATRYELITAAWLAGPPLINLERVRAEVEWMWPSLERFAAHGFGVAAVRAGTVACWCTAEYVGAAHCGLGIETAEAYQRQGLATAAAARCVAHSLRLGREPHWECDSQNHASIRVAEKTGFTRVQTTPFWIGRFA